MARTLAIQVIVASSLPGLGCGDGAAAVRCQEDAECQEGEICSIGDCVPGCRIEQDRCPSGFDCIGGVCCPEIDASLVEDADAIEDGRDAEPAAACPADMVSVDDRFCIDRYEASRPDATASYGGVDQSRATSRVGVIPWYPVSLDLARTACTCAGKRLCTPDEITSTCQGPDQTDYVYGDQYDPSTCNSIDTYCRCGTGTACEAVDECPYPHCYNSPPPGQSTPTNGCGASLHVAPTGSFPDCTNAYGVYDLSGNVWELVDYGDLPARFRGGAYNCIDSESLHRCDFEATNISAKGFRCCRDVAAR